MDDIIIYGILIIILIICIYHIVNCRCNEGFSVGNQFTLFGTEYCNPNTNPLQICSNGYPCPSCGKLSCECPNLNCDAELAKLESICPKDEKCKICIGINGGSAREAGCTNEQIDEWCGREIPHSSDGINITDQPESTIQVINNTSEELLHIYFKYKDVHLDGGDPWTSTTGQQLTLIDLYPNPTDERMIRLAASLGGKTKYYELKLKKNEYSIVNIPNFTNSPPHLVNKFRITPVRYDGNLPVLNTLERPILIEAGKDAIGNMSAVDGINFKVKYEINNTKYQKVRGQTWLEEPTIIEVTHNPCKNKSKGCISPFKQICKLSPSAKCLGIPEKCTNLECTDKVFKPDKLPNSSNCFHGTCNLIGDVKEYCDTIKTGQCLPPDQEYPPDLKPDFIGPYNPSPPPEGQGPSPGHYPGCYAENKYSTYCFDYDDNNSSPTFVYPYKMKITYTDISES